MGSRRKSVRGRASVALLMTILVVVIVLLGSGVALAAPPWSDATNTWWMTTYGVTDAQVGTIADGYPDGTYRPTLDVTRGQFAKMFVDGTGTATATPATPTFTDVPASNYFYPWIEGGAAAGVISGFGDGSFGPNRTIIRQQANSILGSYLAQKELNTRGHIAGALDNYPSLNTWYLAEGVSILAGYADASRVATVHAPATAYLIYKGVVQGTASGGAVYLGPGLDVNRAQAAVLILRMKAVQFSTALPTITLLNPSSGPAAGGNNVIITGTNFTDVTWVKFGTSNATFVVNSATQITAAAPPGTVGTTVDVVVTTAAGASATSAATKYTYGIPIITELDPAAGPAAGGNNVIITGTNFINVSAVKFGTKNATSYVVNSATQITAKAPSGIAGTTVDVTVTTPGGTSAKSDATKYSYGPPTVTLLTPAAGPATGGTTVVIKGTGFTGVTAVKFGTKNALTYEVDSPTQITAVAPSGALGTSVDVRVTTPAGTSAISVLASKYSYGAPSVTSVAPVSGPATGGTQVVITGKCFTGVAAVHFGTKLALDWEVDSPTQITAIAPAGAGVVDVRVTNPVGTSPIIANDEYTYVPAITSVVPNHGPVAGFNAVDIYGAGFVDVTSVSFGGTVITPAHFTINAAGTKISLLAPPGTNTVDIRVNIDGVQSPNTAADNYTYAPTITGLSPTSGSTSGGNTVTITGTGFTGATGATFGGLAGTNFHVVSNTQITVTAPAHAAPGTVEVRVMGPYDLSADAGANDNYTYGGPDITGLNPTHGPTAGGTVVTITGTGFTGATSVTFGGTAGTGLSVNAAGTQITVTTAFHVAGAVNVVVNTPAGSDTLAGGFTYDGPTITNISPPTGPTYGTNTVTITGTGFTGATGVTFGGLAGTGLSVNGAGTQITVTAPAHAAGAVDVVVTTPGGSVTSTGGYTYVTPALASFVISSILDDAANGATYTVQVTFTARDQWNNNLTTYAGTPALTTNTGTVSPNPLTFIAGTGTLTVDVTVTEAGTHTITITDGSVSATSNQFTVM